LREEKAIGQSSCESIDIRLVPTTLKSACIQRLRMRSVLLARWKCMRCDAHKMAELVVVVDRVAIGTLLVRVSGVMMEQRRALLHRGRVRPISTHDRYIPAFGGSWRCSVGDEIPCTLK
jgi:hypothetical protein